MLEDIDRVLLTEEEIKERVAELGAEISRDYAGKTCTCLYSQRCPSFHG